MLYQYLLVILAGEPISDDRDEALCQCVAVDSISWVEHVTQVGEPCQGVDVEDYNSQYTDPDQ